MQRSIQGQTKRMRPTMTATTTSRSILYRSGGVSGGGGAMTQSDASSPESGAPIRPRPLHGLAAMAGSDLILHPA